MARLTEKQRNELVLQQLEALIAGRFEGNLTAAAKAMKLAAPYVHNLVNRKRQPGEKLWHALATVTGKTLAEVIGEREPRWGEAVWWPDAQAEAQRRFGGVSEAAWLWLASLAGPEPPGHDPTTLGMMAMAWDQAASPSADASGRTRAA